MGGHGHSHGGGGGDSHGHSHGNESNHHGHSHGGGHSNDKGHGHSHHGHSHEGSDSQIMKGVFLHILADTLGSVGVIISAILMQLFGWMIADPVCSIFIAVLIALSVGSLVADSVSILMQRSPKALDHSLPDAYQKVMQLEGVQGVHETHFWTLCSNYYCGGLKLEVAATADPKYIVSHTQNIFRSINVTQLFVHLDFIEHGQHSNFSSTPVYGSGYGAAAQGNNLLFQNMAASPGLSPGYNNYNSYGGGHGHGHGGHGGRGHSHDDHSGHGHSHDH